jgi:hypothetical protein
MMRGARRQYWHAHADSRDKLSRLAALLSCVLSLLLFGCSSGAGDAAGHDSPSVLLVCNGSTSPCPHAPHFNSMQAAVDAAQPGDWVFIWPGVYHENDPGHDAGVWITTPRLHIRGLNRNTVIIDGSHGQADNPCPSNPALQDFTPRDGIVVWNASGVTIQNLTVCNYLAGSGATHGTQIWWTGANDSEAPSQSASGWGTSVGGASSGTDSQLGIGTFGGSYLTATSMYHPTDLKSQHLAEFGIFVGGASGPGQITQSYASNMANAALYIGACGRECNTLLADDHGTGSAAGYLGTNSGGKLVVESSTFDHNRAGVVLLSLNTSDLPPPQDGRCPGNSVTSCTIITNNLITDNNNADAPAFGIDPTIGVGVEIQGGSFDTVSGNQITNNGSWGVLTFDNVDSLSSLPQSHCQGGTPNNPVQGACMFVSRGNRIYGNEFEDDGAFGNVTNGDLALLSLAQLSPSPRSCFYDNSAPGSQLTSSPARIQARAVDGKPCALPETAANPALLQQLGCADGGTCTARHANYPHPVTIASIALPRLPTMPNPCAGAPKNAFCRS